jgi:UDP-N-acetylmuramoyl-L-alanyl-D-glutamate--2,6-diaminopimelate ligase
VRLDELAALVPGAILHGDGGADVTDLTCDSRQVRPGMVFVALRGGRADGDVFVPAAVRSGAVAIVTENPVRLADVPQVVVGDGRVAMALMARGLMGDPAERMKLAAVTGTNGKTTTAYLVRHILRQNGARCGMTGTVEYDYGSGAEPAHMTTPESVDLYRAYARMARAGCGYAVSEVSSHSLVQKRVLGIRFAAAVFTNLTQDHLDFHGDMESYFGAKAMLFESLPREAVAVINADDSWAVRLGGMTEAGVVTYGVRGDAQVTGRVMSLSTVGTVFRLGAASRGEVEVHMGLLGGYNVHNALAAAAVGMHFGLKLEAIAEALGSFEGVPGRVESVDCGQDFRVLVDYAHTDDALRSVLSTVHDLYPRRVITVFGCGGDRDRTKRPKMGKVVEELSDVAVVTSDNPRTEDPDAIIRDILEGFVRPDQAIVVPDRSAAIARAIGLAGPGDVVLIAGKGHENYQILKDRRVDFDDRRQARAALEHRLGARDGRAAP